MDKEQAIKRKAELEAELKQVEEILQQPKISKEERFLGLINGLQIKFEFEKYRESLFFFRGDEVWLIYDLKDNHLWILYEKWEVFENEYGMNYHEVQTFIKNMVERHFNLKGVKPKKLKTRILYEVKRHFNLKGVKPGNKSMLSAWCYYMTHEKEKTHPKQKVKTKGKQAKHIEHNHIDRDFA